jgi:hypothetical protein
MPLCPQITNTPVVLPRQVAITAVSYTTTTATYTASGHTFVAGNVVVITGLLPAGYNGTFTISSVSGSTTFTVPNSTNAALTDQSGLATPSGDYVIASVLPVVAATTTQVNAAQSSATSASAAAAAAAAIAATAVQTSANTIVNASNQLTAINGNGITVYAGSSPTSGARVVLNSSGLAGFNTSGSATLAISASTGTVEVTGGILSGGSITGTQINVPTVGSPAFSVNALGQMTATSANVTGTITATAGTIGGFTISSTSIFSSTNLVIESTGNISGGNSQTLFYGFVNIGGGSVTGERLIVAGTSALNGNTGVLGNLTVTNSCTFGAITQQFEFLSSTGNVRVASTYGNSVSGRSMQISSSGLYGTTASTERKKHNIKPYAIDTNALLQLEPISFNYLESIDQEQNPEYGFIAEDADRIGLYELVGYDKEGLPEYFAYEKLPIFLLQLIKELKAEINTLKGE